VKKLIIMLIASFFFFSPAYADPVSVSIAWDNPPPPDGWRVYAAQVGNQIDYTTPITTVTERNATITLDDDYRWRIVVRAYRGSRESEDSNTAVFEVLPGDNPAAPIVTQP
jgi:hypothetical protein